MTNPFATRVATLTGAEPPAPPPPPLTVQVLPDAPCADGAKSLLVRETFLRLAPPGSTIKWSDKTRFIFRDDRDYWYIDTSTAGDAPRLDTSAPGMEKHTRPYGTKKKDFMAALKSKLVPA